MTKAAIYARYSSDNQRDASIADQLRLCRLFADREGWTVKEEYSDHAASGATLLRPGFQALMRDALKRQLTSLLQSRWTASVEIKRTLPDCSSA